MGNIVVVGSINADLTVRVARHPEPGETLLGSGGLVSAGGKGANQALAAALQGASVSMVGAVGRDAYAAPATEYLRGGGVDLRAVAEVEGPTGLALITVAADGENTIIVVPGANGEVTAELVAGQRALLEAADLVLLQGEIPAEGFAQAVALARGRVVVNLAPVVEVPRDALLAAHPLLANEHEAALILRQLGSSDSGETPEAAARGLLDAGFRSVVLTLGARGALVADANGLTPIPTPAVEPVDTTGAGDAFAGALCARLVRGDALREAARHAALVGAAATLRPGAQPSYPAGEDELPAL